MCCSKDPRACKQHILGNGFAGSIGIAPNLVLEIFDTIQQIAANGQTILIVEQNAMMALDIADYCYVLETGNVAREGTPDVMKNDRSIVEAYLG